MDTLFLAYLRNYKGFMENFRETGTGGVLVNFNALANTQVKNLKIGIDAVQSGTGDPSPENIRPITGWSEAKLTRCGKNLYSASTATLMDNVMLDRDTGLVASNTAMASLYMKCKPNTTYTISRTRHNPAWRFNAGYTKELPAVGVTVYGFPNILYPSVDEDGRGSVTIITGADAKYLFVYLVWKNMETIANALSDLQIEISSSVTPYEPYNSTIYTIDLDGTIYGGTLDVTTGVLTVTHGYYEFTADRTYTPSQTSGGIWYILSSTLSGIVNNITDLISNQYKTVATSGVTVVDKSIRSLTSHIYVYDNRFTSAEDVATILTANPIQIVYRLATPQTFAVKPTQIFALEGANNMWADTGNIISFDYYGES